MSPKKVQKVRIAANGYRLCDPLPKGEVLIDNTKQEWVLGTAIGCGGFGDIYSCKRRGDRTEDYVIKLDNISGPLFQEMNFYMRVTKEEQIKKFKDKHRLKFLGIPRFIATGIHDKSSAASNKRNKDSNNSNLKKNAPTVQYRFLVMQRFGDQLDDWVKDKRLTTPKATDIASKMIDVLEYIHSYGYIHADIKGTNILKSKSKSKTDNDWYLVDYGLAERYCDQKGVHRNDKPDKKRANNGTVEYRSRDAHVGCLSRRSDMECLAYNLIQWLYGRLPWMSCLKDAKKVEKLKEDFFEDLDQSLRKCFRKSVPNGLKEFLKLVNDIEFDAEPDYRRFKDILMKRFSKKSSTNVSDEEEEEDEVEDEEEDEEDDEFVRKASQSSSESTIDSLRMNVPLNRQKPKNAKKRKRNNNRKDSCIELSDSENSSSVRSVSKSPPKRAKPLWVNTDRRNGKMDSNATTPKRRSARKSVTRFSTPLLFANSDDEDYTDDQDFDIPVLDLNSSGDASDNQKHLKKVSNKSVKDVIPNETPAMREMRERIEQKKREKEMKKKKK